MSDRDIKNEEIFSKILRTGRRTYFFDVRETKAGDYYLTITESKKFTNEDETFYYKKHKIYLYKEDFKEFASCLEESTKYIIDNVGEEIISNTPYHKEEPTKEDKKSDDDSQEPSSFTDVKFEDI